jgi:polyhydroxyalkanoate synthase
VRYLQNMGCHPFVLDWGTPDESEYGFTVDDYMERLGKAYIKASAHYDEPPIVVGYCMGGLFALALTQLAREKPKGLILLATPFDFHAPDFPQPFHMEWLLQWLEPAINELGHLPVDLLQAMFMSLDPWSVLQKFSNIPDVTAREDMMNFVALEDWLNDGVPLAGPVAQECLRGWYIDNKPYRGQWRVLGETIRPRTIRVPALVVTPERDRIVPPPSAKSIMEQLPNAELLTPDIGHISLMAGRKAEKTIWPELAEWLKSIE